MAATPPHMESLRRLGRPRLRISAACQVCRAKKAKCDGRRPACARCKRRGNTCSYDSDHDSTGERALRKSPIGRIPARNVDRHSSVSLRPLRSRSNQVPPTSGVDTSPMTPASFSSESSHHEGANMDPGQKATYYTAHGRFVGEVAAAIDERSGPATTATSTLIPFVDAPLFGELDLDSPVADADSEVGLPPRAHADELINIYWQYLDPAEPVLDRNGFIHDYNDTYSVNCCGFRRGNYGVWLSVLYAVFALAVQRKESTPLSQRHEEGSQYFRRAWALLRPETIIWKPPSLEVVQSLMLINRYLHCTNNRHRTWMTAGLATRLAQSVCGSQLDGSSVEDSCRDKELKRRVWASCLSLDRCVSWSLGKAPYLLAVPSRADFMLPSPGRQQEDGVGHIEGLDAELLEIGYQIQLAQTQTQNFLAAKLGLPRLYQQDEYQAVAVQVDSCLNRWEKNLPSGWKLETVRALVDTPSRVRGYLMHCRFLHARIFLYRPLLAAFFKAQTRGRLSHGKQPDVSPTSLSSRLIKECAVMCIEAAQKLTSLVIETLDLNEPINALSWWYRILYLHIAGTSFLAAMFSRDLFTEAVSRSWDSVLAALRRHEHLSAYVPRCIGTFEALSAKILAIQCPSTDDGTNGLLGGNTGLFEDIFHDVRFDFDSFLFGPESIADPLQNQESQLSSALAYLRDGGGGIM